MGGLEIMKKTQDILNDIKKFKGLIDQGRLEKNSDWIALSILEMLEILFNEKKEKETKEIKQNIISTDDPNFLRKFICG